MTEAEYKRLLGAVDGEIRDEAIMQLLLQTGMRLAELARLRVVDIELTEKIGRQHSGAVHVHGKDLLWRVRFRRKVHPRQATGDTTYGTVENIVALEDKGIWAHVPLPDMNHRRRA